ncbi:apolipoprotein N-acyltransferase [Microvirga sp. W0021]|uniref:Apolipoprotein N-acyltransferase n=1 Tax=Hohaiivirga grylli TaxID=3133970 RepID=A0ABV0BFI1_9HYPH
MKKAERLFNPLSWAGRLMLAVSGASGALAMQPFAFWLAIFTLLMPPVLMLDRFYQQSQNLPKKQKIRQAALLGWFWGFGYFTAGLWWLGKAFLVEADQFAWAMPFGVIGLPAVLAIYTALAFVILSFMWSTHWSRILVFTAVITLFEWLRGTLLTGFPWNVIGMALGNHLYFMQAAAYIGLYGLTLLTIFIGSAPATLLDKSARLLTSCFALVVLAGLSGLGYSRIPEEPQPTFVNVRLRIVQPNIQQDENFNSSNSEAILENYIELSTEALPEEKPTHYIWPESAFPFILHRQIEALNRIGTMLSKNGNASLITGAARMIPPLPGEQAYQFFNAIQTVDSNGIIRDTYDKSHLVPFGEYEPAFAKSLLRMTGLKQFVSIPGGFTPAEKRAPFSVSGLPPVAANICYEAIFPGEILPQSGARPGVIINVTNDAWFGDSPGPYQHFAQARLRSVEEGLSLVRTANSGISGVIDPYGRILKMTRLNHVEVLDSELPLPLEEQTFFNRLGQIPTLIIGIFIFLLGLYYRRKTA